MEVTKPGWLVGLESSGGKTAIDLSHVRTGAGASGVIPLLPWDHMQGLLSVLEANLSTLQELNLNGLRIGDVGLASLVDRILLKDTCTIHTIDLRHNALTASGIRQALAKLAIFNYTLTTWLLEEHAPNADFNAATATSSDAASSKRPSTRPGPSSAITAKRDKEASNGTLTSTGEPREILSMRFQEIVDKYVTEYLRLNTEAMACAKGQVSHLHLKYSLRHPRLCPTRMAKLVGSLQHVTSLTIEGWIPPPPLTLKQQEKKLAKLSPEQLALKEIKRQIPGTLFASLPKITELKVVKCIRVDAEKNKKGTLRGLLDGVASNLKELKPSSSSSSSNSNGKSKDAKNDKNASSSKPKKDATPSNGTHKDTTARLALVYATSPNGTPIVKSSFFASIPLEIGAMPCLRRLTLSECGLDEITPAALPFMTHVEQIDFSSNDIPSIPPQISSLSNVTRLFLNCNNISDIPHELSSMRYLRELWLYDNYITKIPSDLAKWFPVLKDLRILSQPKLEDLIIEDPELVEFRRQEEDLINTKSSIGCIGFLGMLKLSQTPEISVYKPPLGKKKK